MTIAMGSTGKIIAVLLLLLAIVCMGGGSAPGQEGLGPQSRQAAGVKKVLMVVVRFPDVQPSVPIERVRQKAVTNLGAYVEQMSYGQAVIEADFRGFVSLPDSIDAYTVSAYNFKVDRSRVRKLIEDTMSALPGDVDFSRYDHMLIIPAVHTRPGVGYGMICYCANPGMLSGVRNPRNETVRAKDGREFRGGILVGAENAHVGMFAHDYFHALAGVHEGRRLVPCLYDFQRQSDASAEPFTFDHITIYLGSWDVMSRHFIVPGEPPPGLTSFTRIRLGWIGPDKVRIVRPGDSSAVFLSPLSRGGDRLVVRIPIKDNSYYLIENRQPIGCDRVLPDSGILVYKVDPNLPEGQGTVRLMSADPGSKDFARPAYRLDDNTRNLFVDRKNNVAIIPLWDEDGDLGVLVTTPARSAMALKAATAVEELMAERTGQRGGARSVVIDEAVRAFKSLDFERCLSLAGQGY